MDFLTLADFEPYLNQDFSVRLADGGLYNLRLSAVRDLGVAPAPGLRKPFALYFTNPDKTAYLPQGTYRLEHAQIGELDLFIVPLGPEEGGLRYEVIFG